MSAPQRMTFEECRAAIGGARPAYVDVVPGGRAIVIQVGERRGVLVRYAHARGAYHWVSPESLVRREDCDAGPDPEWLRKARLSLKQPAILFDLLHPSAPSRPAPEFDTDADGAVR